MLNFNAITMAIALSVMPLTVWGETITFDELGVQEGSSARYVGNTYDFAGYHFTASTSQYQAPSGFYVYDTGSTLWTGTPGLTAFGVSATISLERADGSTFSITSLDIARGDYNSGLIPVGFSGVHLDGSSSSAVYWFSDSIQGQNVTFNFGPDFANITKLLWSQGAEWHQFDNIHASPVPVPVPQSGYLLITGCMMLALVSRFRR